MNMRDLAARIINPDCSLAEARALLEETLPLGVYQPELAQALLAGTRDPATIYRLMLASARMAPDALALSMHAYGRHLSMIADTQASLPLLEVAQIAYEWAGDAMGAGRICSNIASQIYRRERYDLALERAQYAIMLFQRAELTPQDELERTRSIAVTLLTVASISGMQRDLDHGLRALGEAESLLLSIPAQDLKVRRSLADIAINRAGMLEDMADRFAEAETSYQQAADRLDEIAVEESALQRFRLHLNRGILQLRLWRHSAARANFDAASAYVDTDNLEDRCDLALLRAYQALLLSDRDEAARQIQQVIDWLANEEADGEEWERLRADLTLYTALLQPAAQGIATLQQAVDGYIRLGIKLMPAIIAIYQAELAYLADQPELARSYLRLAREQLSAFRAPRRQLEIARIQARYEPDVSPPQLRAIIAELKEYGDYGGAAALLEVLARHYEQGASHEQAVALYLETIAAIEEARGMLQLSLPALQFVASRRRPYERAFDLLKEAAPEVAFDVSERARAQVILDEISSTGLQMLLGRAELAELRAARARIEEARARTALQGPKPQATLEPDERPFQVDERRATEQIYLNILISLQARGIAEAGYIRGNALDIATIRSALPPRSALLSYMQLVSADGANELWVTLIGTEGQIAIVPCAGPGDLDLLRQLFAEQPFYRSDGRAPQAATQEFLKHIYAVTFAEIEPLLDGVEQLVVVLDETLPPLPVHAAYLPGQGYLIERFQVSYTPSATVLARCAERAARRAPGAGALLAGWEGDGIELRRLRTPRAELTQLGVLLGTEPLYGPLRSAELLPALGGTRIIHLVCHGIFPQGRHPRFACLALGHDRLYAHDFYRQPLRADLLTMNACDTGLHGPGLQGLVSAALVAGASAVVASMWEVDDSVAPTLMRRFYEGLLREGLSRAEALRQAQLQVLRNHDAHPAAWAPFFLTGLATQI